MAKITQSDEDEEIIGPIDLFAECQYCGKKWSITVWNTGDDVEIRCKVCKDRNIKLKRKVKVNYYV